MHRNQITTKKELEGLTMKYCQGKHCRGEKIKGIACGAYTNQIQILGKVMD